MSGSAHDRNVARKALVTEIGALLDEKLSDLRLLNHPSSDEPERPERFPASLRRWLSPILLGSSGLITLNYWVGIFCFYSGLLITGYDVAVEPWFKKRRAWQTAGLCLIVFGLSLFTGEVLLVPAHLDALAEYKWSAPPPGTPVGGIIWKPQYGELDVLLINNTSIDFTDIDLTIKPDESVAEIGQLSQIAGVSFMTPHRFS
jgi:hypothetical protein